jgi:D-alanyl-D-alanine carboxypeptidase/D-alanyl-D-alanine-endopeptidase (penicillin-binding protein 4)
MSEDTDGGETVVSHTVPDVPRLKLYNHVKASDYTRDNAYIHGAPGTYERSIYGTIPKEKKDFVITGSIPDPAHQLAWELHLLLKEDGFNVKNEPTTTSDIRDWSMPSETEEIHRRQSPALKDILIETNLKSVNTYADVLLKHIGLRYYGQGDFFSGVNAIMQFWGSRGVPRTGWYQEDGSGLSRANSISSKQLALVLAKLNPKFREWFKMGFKSLAGDGDIVAKSGYITRVRAYTGFISIHGTEYAFSILCNNFACSAGEMRKKIEALMSSIKGARLH